MNDPSGYTDRLAMQVMDKIEKRLPPEAQLSEEQQKAVWNSVWAVIYDNKPPELPA